MSKIRFIAGSGRSGTTWVLDSLAKANGLRPVFEPLNPYASDMGYRYAHRALLAGDHHPELRAFLSRAIEGRGERLWTQFRRQRVWLIPSRSNVGSFTSINRYARRLGRFAMEAPELACLAMRREPVVKCIWANLMLGWVAEQLDCQVVVIVRHPGAVIESELRTGWDAEKTLERFRKDPQFHDATEGRYARQLGRKLSHVEALALRWLIENQSHIEDESNHWAMVAFYEDLAGAEPAAWEPVCNHLGLRYKPNATTLARPSQQSSTRAARTADDELLRSWCVNISPEQSIQIQGMLDESQFSCYAMDSVRPNRVPGKRSIAIPESLR
jgi:hypothetical protein